MAALHECRIQAAVVRALLDEVERIENPRTREDITDQLVEELARLGGRLLEAASAMTPMERTSGAYLRVEVEPRPRLVATSRRK